ncbi:MAG: hypothetical protein A2Y23_11530 [Clostridiales bacterium GWB2_37_7]|nr:MAG: hypothetical protein A2Y23_11530 [Clostridiales bacterium GWB2_37_7]
MTDSLALRYYNNGLQDAMDKNIKSAVENLSKAVTYDNNSIAAWNLLGLCFYRLGRFKMAEYSWIQSLNKQSERNPAQAYLKELRNDFEGVAPFFVLVSELCSKKKYKKAVDVFEREIVVRLDSSVEVLNYFGVLKILAGERKRAIKVWERALSIDHSNEKAKLYISATEGSFIQKLRGLIRDMF